MKKILAGTFASVLLLQSCAGASNAIIDPIIDPIVSSNSLPEYYKGYTSDEIDRLYKLSMNTLSKYSTAAGLYSAGEVSCTYFNISDYLDYYIKDNEEFNNLKSSLTEEDLLNYIDDTLYDVDYIEYFHNKNYLVQNLKQYYETGLIDDFLKKEKDNKLFFDISKEGIYSPNIKHSSLDYIDYKSRSAFISLPKAPLLVRNGIIINSRVSEIRLMFNTDLNNPARELNKEDFDLNFYFYDKIINKTSKPFAQKDITSSNEFIYLKSSNNDYITDFNPLTDYCYKKTITLSEFNRINRKIPALHDFEFDREEDEYSFKLEDLLNNYSQFLPKVKNLSSKIGVSLTLSSAGIDKINSLIDKAIDYLNTNKEEILNGTIENPPYELFSWFSYEPFLTKAEYKELLNDKSRVTVLLRNEIYLYNMIFLKNLNYA